MIEKPNYISLTQYFKGDSSEEVTKAVESWKEENNEEFHQLQSIWEKHGSLASTYQPNLTKAWANIDDRTPDSSVKNSPLSWVMKVAASLVILATVIWFWNTTSYEYFHAVEGNMPLDLADKTMVTLAQGATLKVDKEFGTSNRHVTLEGKAFFEVAKNESTPFQIDMNDVKIVVVGTKFQVNNKINTVEIVMTEGVVEVSAERKNMTLTKGKLVVNKETSNFMHTEQVNDNHLAWKSGVLSFNEAYLADFALDLEDYYGFLYP